ncbi:RNA-binding S4 domain-containing protein [Thiomicrorhabdus sp.]|uniref:RNA-binding S4 domain-containing protein n=1 Tax=Thiomicrorhabdus sp. TaxID=2039724 RepID=UPI0029C6EFAF|nr:RNA-binding S4 domain-containing protein [Thiomicrorhabdus sp.]
MEKIRIDKWLWAARFFKTRGVALDAVKGGKVELNGIKPKPSKTVSIGDKLKITQPHRLIDIEVVQLSDKRGNAQTAQQLYSINNEILNQNKPSAENAVIGYRDKGSGRPTKRDRRKIDAFKF